MDDAIAGMEGSSSELELETVESFERAMKQLSNLASGRESTYIEIPEMDHTKLVVPNDYIHDEIELDWLRQQAEWDERNLKSTRYTKFQTFRYIRAR